MTDDSGQSSKVGKTGQPVQRLSPNQRKYADVRSREHLLEEEVEAMMAALRRAGGRHAHRDATLIKVLYRHGLRRREASALKWEQIDFASANLHVVRVKQGTPSTQPLQGDTLRDLRKLKRDYPDSAYVFTSSRKGPLAPDSVAGIVERAGQLAGLPFPVHTHMLRHGCGYHIAKETGDTRLTQAYLGHRNIQHTVRYTQLAPGKFKGIWKK